MANTKQDLYLVRRVQKSPEASVATNTYEVAKYSNGDGAEPANVYKVEILTQKSQAWCSCPGFRSMLYKSLTDPKCADHKHIRLVGEFVVLREPWLTVFWFDTRGEIQHRAFGLPLKEILNVKE